MSHLKRSHGPPTLAVSACLFGSGLCALIYQTAWFREFRLIFGASTSATAAVMAIFMGGVGWGSAVLGKRADRSASPLRWYGLLELGIAVTVALSPLLLVGVRAAYLALGGSATLGPLGAAAVRLALGAVVLGIPTFLMGGTLPAAIAARPGERRAVAICYGANALGAVTGVMLATFWLLETLGNRGTLCSACALNVLVALGALALAHQEGTTQQPASADPGPSPASQPSKAGTVPASTFYTAAAFSGFGFFLMELVWYRMLAPLLGGSTFTFGLILAVALAGIALGSLMAAWFLARREPTMNGFIWLCGLQAIVLAVPFAMGDRLATWAMLTQSIGQFSFAMRVLQWSVTAAAVVLPASVAAGAQFPLLIALLGCGRGEIGRHTGTAYAWNTLGAIGGSLAGGFGLLPAVTAPGAWRLVVAMTVGLSLSFSFLVWKRERRWLRQSAPLGLAALALGLLLATGPTAVWRHSPIGAGRTKIDGLSRNDLEFVSRERRRAVVWEAEGRESSVALLADDGYAFLVNGKSDGHSRSDAGTQVMSGMLGALMHPAPRQACVIGLGTGSTAGWLAQVPSVHQVDVVELEPVISNVAAYCAPVNKHALENPKVRLTFNDAREAMLTSRARYDLIVSEPSNPYRAGVASLFSREFYQAIIERLAVNGLFLQWIQAYEIDGTSVSSICATLASVFSSVEVWQTESGDLLLAASPRPLVYDVARWRERITEYPFNEALSQTWYVNDLEGVFSHFVANAGLARSTLAAGTALNTDDRNLLEFALARNVGRQTGFSVEDLRRIALANQWRRPRCVNGTFEVQALADRSVTRDAAEGVLSEQAGDGLTGGLALRTRAKYAFAHGSVAAAADLWSRQPESPTDPYELLLVALGRAAQGDAKALEYTQELRSWRPLDADAVEVHYLWVTGRFDEAMPRLEKLLQEWRRNPWASDILIRGALEMIRQTRFSSTHRSEALRLYEAITEPFAVRMHEDDRIDTCLLLAQQLDDEGSTQCTQKALAILEPHFPWEKRRLTLRAECYAKAHHPLATKAQAELARFTENEAGQFAYRPRMTISRVSARGRTSESDQ